MTTKQKISAITPDWIREQMAEHSIPNPNKLAELSGVRYESLTMALTGTREVSRNIKSTLYWYFLYLSVKQLIDEETE